MKTRRFFAFVLMLSIGSLANSKPLKYRILDIGILPGATAVYPGDLNDNDVVVGSVSYPETGGQGFIWSRTDGMRESLPPGTNDDRESAVVDINSVGQAVGAVSALHGYASRFVVIDRDGNFSFPLTGTWANGYVAWISKINDNGVVIGESQPFYRKSGTVFFSPWVWTESGGISRILDDDESKQFYVRDINNQNQIVGQVVQDYDCGSRAFLYPESVTARLGGGRWPHQCHESRRCAAYSARDSRRSESLEWRQGV